MTGLWLGYDWVMTGLWLGYDWVMTGLWLGYDWVMTGLWLGYDWVMTGLWLGYDWVMTGLWLGYDFHHFGLRFPRCVCFSAFFQHLTIFGKKLKSSVLCSVFTTFTNFGYNDLSLLSAHLPNFQHFYNFCHFSPSAYFCQLSLHFPNFRQVLPQHNESDISKLTGIQIY